MGSKNTKRRNATGGRKQDAPQVSSKKVSAASSQKLIERLFGAGGFGLGMLLVWSLLSPADATSVFVGEAIPQNLFWLVVGLLAAAAASVSGLRFEFSRWNWSIALLCLVWLIVGAIAAGRLNNPRIAWNGFWQVVALGACFFSARALLSGPRSRTAIVRWIAVGCLALSFQGVHQLWIQSPADRARYEADPDAVLASIGLVAPPGSAERKRFEDRLNSPEPTASFALANSLAVPLSGGLILIGGILLTNVFPNTSVHRSGWHRLPSLLLLSAFLSIAFVWFSTFSRTAYVAVAVAILFGVMRAGTIFKGQKALFGRGILATGLVIGAVAGLAGLWWLLRNDQLVISEAPKSLAFRLEYWLATLRMIGDHGLFGVGLGNFQAYYPQYKMPAASEIIADPHNWLLDLQVNLSVPVGLAIAFGIASVFRIGRQTTALHGSSIKTDVENGETGHVARQTETEQPSASERAELAVPAALTELEQADRAVAIGVHCGVMLGGALCAALLSLIVGLDLMTIAMCWLPAAAFGIFFDSDLAKFASCKTRDCEVDSSVRERPAESRESGLLVLAQTAALSMLVCLLVSGSWQASGIAVPLLLLLVVGGRSELKLANLSSGSGLRKHVALCWLPVLGLLCFLGQCWRPVTTGWSLMQQAMSAMEPAEQIAFAEAAYAADPLDTEPLGWIAQLLARQASDFGWGASGSDFGELSNRSLDQFDIWLARDSVRPTNWDQAGRAMLDLASAARNRQRDDSRFLEQAVHYYQEAVKRYPSSVVLRVQSAATLTLVERWQLALDELETAEQLSQATPHGDKKLASQLLWLPVQPKGAELEFEPSGPWIKAELFSVWLRNAERENFAESATD